ncbi:PITH domain-containing protein [Gossypium australe]|uniref:PITH domain-containing protein n=1 Tax=Gossypium australe TaxID=47621 RepID=A0A5B6VV32_9ROSI|nr:PITH domain-containing protein [Gossypium australe]
MAAAESATAIQRNQVDLLDFIDWSGVECLNQSSVTPCPMLSSRDPKRKVKLSSAGPKTVKLFRNSEHMGISNVNDFPPSDTDNL